MSARDELAGLLEDNWDESSPIAETFYSDADVAITYFAKLLNQESMKLLNRNKGKGWLVDQLIAGHLASLAAQLQPSDTENGADTEPVTSVNVSTALKTKQCLRRVTHPAHSWILGRKLLCCPGGLY